MLASFLEIFSQIVLPVLAIAALMLVLRARRKPVKGRPLTPAEQQRLQALLTDGPDSEPRS